MRTYSEFCEEHRNPLIWTTDGGLMENDEGDPVLTLDALAYLTCGDMVRDHDNTLAIARETVIDDSGDREPMTIAELTAYDAATWRALRLDQKAHLLEQDAICDASARLTDLMIAGPGQIAADVKARIDNLDPADGRAHWAAY